MKKFGIGILVVGAVVCLVVTAVGTMYLFSRSSKSKSANSAAAKIEIKKTIDKVSALILLPKGEEPTVATVADKTKLASQPFFQLAENGDKVLIYVKAGVAILYRPSVNKIVTVAPVQTVANNPTSPTPSAMVTQKIQGPQIVMYNGTTKTGLTFTIERLITKQFADIVVADRLAAVKSDYPKTLIIDVSKKFSEKARDIATALSGELTTLPAGEKKPTADILIIVGKDKIL